MFIVLKASEQLLYEGVQISDELNTFYTQCQTSNDVQVSLQTSLNVCVLLPVEIWLIVVASVKLYVVSSKSRAIHYYYLMSVLIITFLSVIIALLPAECGRHLSASLFNRHSCVIWFMSVI